MILSNALDAMPEGGGLYASSAVTTAGDDPAAESIEIRFKDTGVGVPEEDLAKLFEPFFTTKADRGCIGLGLSLAYGIIMDHGGWIHVTSRQAGGATVTINPPIHKND